MSHGVHAVVDGEIAADEVGAHGGALACQRLIAADTVCSVLAVVDAHGTCVSAVACVGVVDWFGPVAAAAEAWVWTWLVLVFEWWDWLEWSGVEG
jgi:hypothetical protein